MTLETRDLFSVSHRFGEPAGQGLVRKLERCSGFKGGPDCVAQKESGNEWGTAEMPEGKRVQSFDESTPV